MAISDKEPELYLAGKLFAGVLAVVAALFMAAWIVMLSLPVVLGVYPSYWVTVLGLVTGRLAFQVVARRLTVDARGES